MFENYEFNEGDIAVVEIHNSSVPQESKDKIQSGSMDLIITESLGTFRKDSGWAMAPYDKKHKLISIESIANDKNK